MTVRIEVLGPVRVLVDGTVVPLRGLARTLLAGLSSRAGDMVPVPVLVRWLWSGGPPPRKPRQAVHALVHRLREVVGDLLRTTPGGYVLAADADSLDLAGFRRLVTESERHEAAGRTADAGTCLDDALALWQSSAFVDVDSDTFRHDEAEPLNAERIAAARRWANLRLQLGLLDGVAPELTRLVREHPSGRRLHELLITVLLRSGRRAEALAEYDRLGVPSPGLRALLDEQGTAAEVPRQLPSAIPHFVGRSAELRRLAELAAGPATVVVEGTAGVGKTALAVTFAHRSAEKYPGGQIFLNLRGYEPDAALDATSALLVLLHSIGVPGDTVPAAVDERVALWRARTAYRRLLVILDNVRDRELLAPLLPGPGCTTLVTTRDRQAGPGLAMVTVEPMPPGDGVRLLSRILGEERVTHDPEAGRRFVARCAGLPLAIRILSENAGLHPGLSLRDFLGALDGPDDLTAFAVDDDPAADLRSVFAHSYRALDQDTARLFRLLGLHPGVDFTARAAAALAGIEDATAQRRLSQLTAAHLVEEPEPGRFRFHDLLRAYAKDLCGQQDTAAERDAATGRLLDWFLAATAEAGALLLPHRRVHLATITTTARPPALADLTQAREWCRAEYPNLLAAIRLAAATARHRYAWQLPWALQSYLLNQTLLHDGLAVHDLALTAARHLGDQRAQAWILTCRGFLYTYLLDDRRALDSHRGALDLRRAVGDRMLEGESLLNLALVHQRTGEQDQALRDCLGALAIARELGLRYAELACLSTLAGIEIALGRYAGALGHLHESIAIQDKLQDRHHDGLRLTNLGLATAGLGKLDESAGWLRRAVEAFRDNDESFEESSRLVLLGEVHRRRGAGEAAQACFDRARRLVGELVDQQVITPAKAARWFDEAMALFGPGTA
ncbi:AfsR/SARP family transcriptional regulator [Amycolatopsis suaedae]|uniref:Tetratricopeptide repeat protein n=1 Tax=Amycolatopsis suaedae TaxID=2510978 RepID=A0A4Q7J1K3_9PSEU|nr:BTAD domain-containing putative transcriptional regulator [Amycolatopsis suaedae]RZQ61271.1 tetratricopeptide repeat protein [Amycolatopsis suaedae]